MPVHAQTLPEIKGPTLDGQPFDLARSRGKVVMVLFWSTDSATCRDSFGAPVSLSAVFLLDKSGRLVQRYQCRVPPVAWNRTADLQ